MTPDRYKPLLDREFLKGRLDYEYRDWLADGGDARLKERPANWARRATQVGARGLHRALHITPVGSSP